MKSQYPVEGSVVELKSPDGSAFDVAIHKYIGAARLCWVVNELSETGILALQPDGSWYIVKDFEPDWEGHASDDANEVFNNE